MNILITGGTGLVGSKLVQQLSEEKNHLYVLTRSPKKHRDTEFISYISYKYPMKKLPFIHAVINLAGESLFGYWSPQKKERIRSSRINITEKLTNILMQMDQKPNVFISGSAVGYYGMSEEKIFTEATTEPGDDFLASVCSEWEATASIAGDLGIRTVYTRFGVIFDKTAGALPLMALPFKFGAGGKVGNGKQWLSWVHIDDCVRMIKFALYDKQIFGPLNVTAPNPKRNEDFSSILASVLRRPSFLTTPELLFKLAVGDMHQLVTEGQFVYPHKALENGFTFKFPHLEEALADIFNK